jgi:hypothetical protein
MVSIKNIERPPYFEAITCNLSNKIFTRETWNESIYAQYENIFEDENRVKECWVEAKKRFDESLIIKSPYEASKDPEQQIANSPPLDQPVPELQEKQQLKIEEVKEKEPSQEAHP